MPTVSAPAKMERIRQLGAELVVTGDRYADALDAAQAWAAASASAYLSPVTTSSAPSCRIRSILAGADTVGTKILAGTLCLPPKPTLDAA